MTTRRQARILLRAASGTVSGVPALRKVPRLHALVFFSALGAPLLLVWLLRLRGLLPGVLDIVLPLATVSLAAFLALPVGGMAQALAAAGARQAWERRPGGLRTAWGEVRPHLGSLVWRGMGPDGLFGGRDVAQWVYADRAVDPSLLPRHRLFGRGWALVVVLGALALGLPTAFALMTVLGTGEPATDLAMSFLLALGVSFSLTLYGGGVLGIFGAVEGAAEHHAALFGSSPPGFPPLAPDTSPTRRRPETVRFQRL